MSQPPADEGGAPERPEPGQPRPEGHGARTRVEEAKARVPATVLASISAPFITRPVATTLLTIGLLLAGLTAYRSLPVAALPQVDYPTIVVSTQLPGASPETMASAVTTPLERQFGQVPSLTQMTSVSSFGSSQITLQFELDRDIDGAEQDVQAAINAATNLLPRTLPAPPTYSKSNPADQPILTIAVSSDTLPLPAVSDYADSVLAQKISQVKGVGLVTTGGGQKPAVRVQVDPMALAGTGLTLEDVRAAIAAANVNQPKGNLDGPRQNYALATDDQLAKAQSFRPLIVAYRNGSPVRLGEVANVIDDVENAQLAGWSGTKRAVLLSVQRQPGANIIEVTDDIKELLPRLRASMPQAIDVEIIADRTVTVRASVEDVQFTLVLTIFLVIAVIFLFLGNLRATVIPGVAVPLALIGTFAVMKAVGYSLDNLSLMALTISTGFVVDDAIVMVENVSRLIEGRPGEPGLSPFEAALRGAKQIGFTIVSLTVSLVAVLIPLLFMGGLVGRLFREFAVTLAIAIAISAVLSLTLTAMMCAWVLRPHDEHAPRNLVVRTFDRGFRALTSFYEHTLAVALKHRVITLLVTLAAVAVTALLALAVPKGFFPVQDTGQIAGVSEAAPDVSFGKMMELQRDLAEKLLEDPAVATVSSSIGADGTNPAANVGRFAITLRPMEERSHIDEVMARLKARASAVSGIALYVQPVQDLTVDARMSRTQYQYTIEDPDPDELAAWAPRLLEAMRALPQLRDVASDQQSKGLELHLDVDRDSASRLGITALVLDDTLYDAFGQRIVSTTFTQLNQYRIILEVRPEDRHTAAHLERLHVRSASGVPVPLSSFATLVTREAPLSISHQGQFPSVTLSFDTAPGVSLGEAVAAIEEASAKLEPPPAMRGQFTGAAQAFRESLASTPFLILAALITVYIVLGVLYESYIHPITILSTLPSAGIGAILALYVVGMPFDVIALIGIVLLIGIVQKNAIMMIDFALEAEREEGLPPEQAIAKACLLRFRPIMMTTMAALLGGLPLALGTGVGAELRKPLGVTIVGGLLLSQVLTLYTTPVIYLFMEKVGRWFTSSSAKGVT
ncbi:MAG: multidrug efflux RND transporter permease subunit [Deltaproteobacteria bacterium]|nr:multidrug efflux RND transporter permease subunit [Deltaproteobacteria bacterium]